MPVLRTLYEFTYLIVITSYREVGATAADRGQVTDPKVPSYKRQSGVPPQAVGLLHSLCIGQTDPEGIHSGEMTV